MWSMWSMWLFLIDGPLQREGGGSCRGLRQVTEEPSVRPSYLGSRSVGGRGKQLPWGGQASLR